MTPRAFGRTGLMLMPLGFGAMHFDAMGDEREVERLLNGVLDLGVNLIDTARGYGRSEERIGRHLAQRRSEFVLSTKFGYGVEGVPDWTHECIVRGVERALRLMRTDVIDIGHLHSCPLAVLQRGEVTQALADCVQAGKLRVAAYSGENAALAHALADSRFGSVQCSLSLVDSANAAQLPPAQGQGVIIKRALAGQAWARTQRPAEDCEGEYWQRWQALQLQLHDGASWPEVALRFAVHHAGVSAVLVGSKNLTHIKTSIDAVAEGPLPESFMSQWRSAWQTHGSQWPGMV